MADDHSWEAGDKICVLRTRSISEMGEPISFGRIAEVVANMIHEKEEKLIREHLSYMSGAKLRAVLRTVADLGHAETNTSVSVRKAEIDRNIAKKAQNAVSAKSQKAA